MKPTQFFSNDYLKASRRASPTQIARFLEDYRILQKSAYQRLPKEPSKLISLRLSLKTLSRLKTLAKARQVPYQTLLKQLIETGLEK